MPSYPQAILHVDGDAFFASVAQAQEPKYKGKPLISGAERGIIAAASYEAKALGIKRGISIADAKKICPDLIVVPTDYETCGLYSKRMIDIIRRYSPVVEEYSIDEAFADITGLRRAFHCSYETIAKNIQVDVKRELDLSVSVGVSLSKGLAKICSDFRKPAGIVCVSKKHISILLSKTPLQDIWGIGINSAALLNKYNIKTALDFINMKEHFVKKLLGKLGMEMWRELNGEYIYKVNPHSKTTYQSVSKSKTFSPPTRDKAKTKAFLLRNLESACIKIRRYNLMARKIYISLKNQGFESISIGANLSRASSNTLELAEITGELFDKIFQSDEYRATLVVLSDLKSDVPTQVSIFDDPMKIEKIEKISETIDELNHRFGKHTLHIAGTLQANKQHIGKRGTEVRRKQELLPGETFRKRLNLPMSFVNV